MLWLIGDVKASAEGFPSKYSFISGVGVFEGNFQLLRPFGEGVDAINPFLFALNSDFDDVRPDDGGFEFTDGVISGAGAYDGFLAAINSAIAGAEETDASSAYRKILINHFECIKSRKSDRRLLSNPIFSLLKWIKLL